MKKPTKKERDALYNEVYDILDESLGAGYSGEVLGMNNATCKLVDLIFKREHEEA